ncbi:hypothetical protein N9D31_02945 [Oligoflexaceae bacterium]|nr:hypothetical protein [Oligoflexaceae bacterium]
MRLISSVFFMLLLSSPVLAISFKVSDVCSKKLVLNSKISIKKSMTVSQATSIALRKNKVPHQFSGRVIKSILNTPVGMDAIDVYSDESMAAFGWCVLVNGKLLQQPIYKQMIKKESDSIHWFYGSAFLDKDEWKDMCVPSFKRQPRHLCR